MADNGFNLATLWVPVVPDASQVGPAMEEAGKQAKGRFGEAVKGFGKAIHDDLDKIGEKTKDTFSNAGKHAKDAFSKAGKTAGEAFNSELGKELQASVGDEIGKAIGNAVKEIPGFETAAKYVEGFTAASQTARTALESIRDTIHSTKVGDFGSALQGVENTLKGVEPIAKTFGIDVSGWEGPLGEVRDKSKTLTDTYDQLKGNVKDTTTGFLELTNNSGRISGGLNAIAAAAGPLAGTFAALDALMPGFDQHLNNVLGQLQGKQGFNIKDWINTLVPGTGLMDQFFQKPYQPGGQNVPPPPGVTAPPNLSGAMAPVPGASGISQPADDENDLGTLLGASPRGGRNFYKDWYPPTTPAVPAPPSPPVQAPSIPSSGSATGSDYTKPSFSPNISTPADLRAAGSRIANLYRVAQALNGTPYSKGLRNDCSGMVSQLAAAALGMPAPGPGNRFTTVNEGQWLMSHGFEPGLGGPNDLNIGWYDHGGGDAGHTAATLPGGIHAESGGSHGNFLLGPGAAGAENPEFTQHAHLSLGGGSVAGQSGPMGSKSDPLYVSSADSGSGGGSSGPWESQGQQLGQGMVNGIMQMFGLDGSVFKGFGSGKGLLDFGALKLGGGLMNWGMQLAQSRSSMGPGSASGGMGMALGGDGASIPGLGMIPNLGAAISAKTTANGPGAPRGGDTTIIHGDVNSGFNVTQHGVQGSGYQDWKEAYNANSTRTAPLTVPNAGGLPAG